MHTHGLTNNAERQIKVGEEKKRDRKEKRKKTIENFFRIIT
jgi:hypothetical protein